MKTNYKAIKALIVLLSVITIKAGAQALSGAYTINGGAAASASNFQTFNAFATALNTNGISGPVTVNVVTGSGPYNEQVIFNQATGMSFLNKITVNGNGNTLAFTSTNSAMPHTLLLNGADYMTFDNLNVSAQGATYAMAVVLTNAANNNTFSNSTFSCTLNGTSTTMSPFAVTSSSTSPTGSGTDSGNYNTVSSCTLANGYYGATFYGNTGAPYQQSNSLINSLVTDFYYAGVYYPYAKGQTIKGNTFQRPTRTTSSTIYALYGFQTQVTTIDGNKIWKMYESNLNASSIFYAMYVYGNPVASNERSIIRNNLITGIKNNSSTYGIYAYSSNADIYNNTIDLDNANATAGTVYGMYPYGTAGFNNNIYNNIISISRGSSTGTKYGINFSGVTGNVTCDNNVIYMNNSAGTNYYGYYSSAVTSFTAYQAQGVDANSYSLSPAFANQANYDLHPTNSLLDNKATLAGLLFDQSFAVRNQINPDLGALEFLTPNCSGSPSLTSVMAPGYLVCPGSTSDLLLSTIQSDAGISFQWQMSTISPVGPWTSISGANLPVYTTPTATGTVYYSAKVTCANGSSSIQAVSGAINVAGTTTNNVPYTESFENIAYNGMLPNCSWAVSAGSNVIQSYTNTSSNYRLPHNGSHKFMSFNAASTGTNYVYTSGIMLKAGVTYSAGLFYLTEYSGLSNFTDLSIMLGNSQTPAGLVTIASTNGPAVATQYKSLSGTFTVATTGIYYVAVRAANTSANYYLTFDDLFVTIPCSLNSPALAVTGLSTACLGTPVNLSASGADAYVWSSNSATLSTTNALSNTPNQAGIIVYTVTGTNNLSSCSIALSKTVTILAGPVVSAHMNDANNAVCPGEAATLFAIGSANSYTWSTTGIAGANTTVMPTSATVYTVMGSNATNCISSATILVSLKTAPSVSGAASHTVICAGENVILSAMGADTYSWTSNAVVLLGNNVIATPQIPTNYQLTGVDMSTGCTGSALVSVNVNKCTGISSLTANSAIQVYPNPTAGEFVIESGDNSVKTISVTDVTGRELMSTTSENSASINISQYAAGVYYVKIQSSGSLNVVKVVKH